MTAALSASPAAPSRTAWWARPGSRVAALAAVTVSVAVVDLAAGVGVPMARLMEAAVMPGSVDGAILRLIRGPRVATALLAGAALGVSGAQLQAVLRNPLASPEFTGINPTAVVAVVLALATGAVSADHPLGLLVVALLGGLVGGASSWVAARRATREGLLLAGIMAGALAGGITTVFIALRSEQFGNVLRWLVGSVDGRVWIHLQVAGPWIAVWLVVATLATPLLLVVAGGDDHAHALGVGVDTARLVLLGTATALASGAAALAGAMVFIGLLVPHLGRALVGLHPRLYLPACALAGAALLAGCDAVAQGLTVLLARADTTQQVGVPAGAVAAVVGALVLVRLARHHSGTHT